MGLNLVYKKPQPRGYDTGFFYIDDISETSPQYFDVQHFPASVGGGRSVVVIKGSGDNLRLGSTIDVEIKDANGDNVFAEVTNYVDRFDNYYITFEIYDITAQGLATVYLVGEAAVDPNGDPIPSQYRGSYNVRWSRQLIVRPFDRNNSELIFDQPPTVDIVQVITPERTLISQTGSQASQYTIFTSSVSDLTIVNSDFQGYDRDFASSPDILDPRLKGILINPTQKPSTTNTVNTSLRVQTSEIDNGYIKEQSSRFNTVVISSGGLILKDYLGGTFNFYDSASTPKSLTPTPGAGFAVSGSTSDQLSTFSANIVEVISSTQMRISKPLEVTLLSSSSIKKDYTTTFKYSQASNFTASITYMPSDGAFVTSSVASQSYLEVTFSDLKPISGDIYRIKTYYKRGIASGEFKPIYDHIVRPVEYLTEATYPNQTGYAVHDSDYRLIGHFTSQEIATTYWDEFVETPDAIYIATTATISSRSLHESYPIQANYTQSRVLTTKFYQNYISNQTYTLSCLVALDPNVELEFYMTSDPLNPNTYLSQTYPRGFSKDINTERSRYSSYLNRFGKYLGKVKNPNPNTKYYGRVEFDFETDADGFGRPVFRANPISIENSYGVMTRQNVTGSAYVAEISIKPFVMNGFSPNLVQYAIPFNNEIDNVLTLSQSLDFKIEYFDYTGKQSEYITTIDDLTVNLKGEIPCNTCQSEINYFYLPTNNEIY